MFISVLAVPHGTVRLIVKSIVLKKQLGERIIFIHFSLDF